VYASQLFSPLYYRLVGNHDIASAQTFLNYIKGTPLYKDQYAYFNGLFDNGLIEARTAEEQKNVATKDRYRSMLSKNPKSRDALIMLALYELRAGNDAEASRFYTQAKEIDPWLNIASLE
jgi:TolA-binding protein